MKKLSALLNNNVINVLIVTVSLLLVIVVAGGLYIFFKSPARDQILSDFFPTPTLALKDLITSVALTAQANATATPAPTITTMPFTPFPTATATIEINLFPTASPTLVQPTPTVVTSTPDVSATPIATLAANAALACIPSNPSQTGRVVEVIDGNTIRVLMDGLVYNIRYIGVALPAAPHYAQAAAYENGQLVFSKQVTLIADAVDKDEAGRLLRYVKAGDKFINLELIKRGLGSAADIPPKAACTQAFTAAEQAARADRLGQWASIFPTP